MHVGLRYSQENNNALQISSFDESSCFFDEFNRDEETLHNCGSVNAYNMWPKIINNVTISLNPKKNEDFKNSITLNDLVSKLPIQK